MIKQTPGHWSGVIFYVRYNLLILRAEKRYTCYSLQTLAIQTSCGAFGIMERGYISGDIRRQDILQREMRYKNLQILPE